jgi:hypothetical protein
MKKVIFSIISFGFFFVSFSQETIQKYKVKIYIFDGYEEVHECSVSGKPIGDNPTTALKGSLFSVEKVPDDTHLIIRFRNWDKRYADKRKIFNFNTDNSGNEKEPKFFVLEKSVFDKSCSEYIQRWNINFGALTTPFKFRRDPFLFTTNLNLGTSVSFQKIFSINFTWGIVAGLSLSSVTLDSFSTKGIVLVSTERPAVTPSISGMIGYKNINLTVGFGWDLINKTSALEKSWAYDGKKWIGIGLGVSLFNSTGSQTNTTSAKGQ